MIDIPSLVKQPYRTPNLNQRRQEIQALAEYLHNKRHLETSQFIQDNPGLLTWHNEKDIHLHLWQQATKQARRTT